MSWKIRVFYLTTCSKVTFFVGSFSFKCHWRGALGVAVSSIKLLPICTSNAGKVGWKSTEADWRNTTRCSILCGMGDCNLAHVRVTQKVDVRGLVCQDPWDPMGIQWRVPAKVFWSHFLVCWSFCKSLCKRFYCNSSWCSIGPFSSPLFLLIP